MPSRTPFQPSQPGGPQPRVRLAERRFIASTRAVANRRCGTMIHLHNINKSYHLGSGDNASTMHVLRTFR